MNPLAMQQQALLTALFGRWDPSALAGQATQPDGLRIRGLQAYRSNGQALAARALSAAFPVLTQMLGEDNLAALARAYWQTRPPVRGDIAQWGEDLPRFIADAPQLQEEPFLADVARVEWALHVAATAADVRADPASFRLLVELDPSQLLLVTGAGVDLVASPWPVASLVNAHLAGEPSLGQVSQWMLEGRAEAALVWRESYRPRVREAAPGEAALVQALRAGQSLACGLDAAISADAEFDFQAWLAPAVQTGLVVGARTLSI